MTTTIKHIARSILPPYAGRAGVGLLLFLLLMMAGAQGAWAADDSFIVSNTTGADLIYKGGTALETGGTYTSLTLGFAADSETDLFKIGSGQSFIGPYDGETTPYPSFEGNVPTGGYVYVFAVSKPGSFLFDVKLNNNKTIHFRNTSGTDLNVRTNQTGANIDNYKWAVEVEVAGTYYLYAEGSKLPLYGYTFTRKVPAGITSLPYHADFGSNIEPFDDGNKTSGTNISNVFTINSVSPNSGTAIARFNGVHTLASTEQVTLSFTAYHGYYNKGGTSKVTLYNSDDRPLVSYTYNKQSGYITEIMFDGVQADDFAEFNARSVSGASGANGFGSGSYPFTNNAADNPVITMTVLGTGQVSFHITRTSGSLDKTYNASLTTVKKDLAYIKIEDTSDNADRGLGIDNLSITSKLASLDYETEVVDWTTSESGRYTPTILTESGNHYLSVKQDERNNNGAALTSTSLSGSVPAGTDYTISFDMKIANTSTDLPSFMIKDAANSNNVFSIGGNAANTENWLINGTEVVALGGTFNYGNRTSNTYIADDLTWYHFVVSKTKGYTYVTITDKAGSTYYLRKGFVNNNDGGLGNLVFNTGRYYSDFAIDNIQVVPYASTTFTQDGKDETYTIMGEGALPQSEQGKTIGIEYGTTEQVQMTAQNGTYFGAYCVDNNPSGVYSRAWGTVPSTIFGTYYKLTPVYDGTLSVTGWVSGKNNLVLVDNSNNLIASKPAADLTANTLFTYDFTPTLTGGSTYYLFVADSGTGHNTTGEGIADDGVFYLSNLTFTQTHMNRDVAVKDLLYAGNKSGDNLVRTIPGMTLAFNDKVTSGVGRDYLNFETDGTMTITLRQNGYNATVSGVTLVNNGTKLNTGYTVNTSVSGVATITASESLSVSGFIVSYNGDGGESNYKLWLNEDKTDIGTLAIANSHIMRVPGDGRAFTNSITFAGDDAHKWWVENTDYLHTSSNTSIATINTDGTNGQLLQAGSATITATFQETDYFNEKSISYIVDNVLLSSETYNVNMTNGQVIRIGAYASAENTNLSLTNTSASTMTFGTTAEKKYTKASATGTVTLKNETANNITINSLQAFSSLVVAWLYYEGQENNYSQQMHFQNFASGDVKGFRVYDIGDPIDPIDLTDTYEYDGAFSWEDGTLVKASHHGGTFSADKGSFIISGKDSGTETTLPKVKRGLKRKAGTPSDGYPATKEATANIFIATPTDEDGDSENDTYKIWDMTASVTGSGQMDSRWAWNGNGHFYQTSLPEYLPILNNTGTTLAGNEGLLVKGDMRYHTGTNGLRLNLTKANSYLKFPVKAGMEVKVVMASSSADMTHIIKNVTDLMGVSTEKLYIENPGVNSPVTVYYLAESDGAVEIRSMDRSGAYVKSVTLQVPKIHFEEEIVVVKNEVADITNVPYNTGDATLTYSIGGSYNLDGTERIGEGSALATIADANVGKVSVSTANEGYVVVNVTNPSATGVRPKKGSYRLYMIDFRFNPTAYNKDTDADESGSADFPSLDLSSAAAKANNGEAVFDKLPTGYDKVISPVNYTMSVVSGSPRGRLTQTTNSDPKLTTYQLTAYSPGTIRVTATTGRITTYCDVTISGGDNLYAEMAPVRLLEDLPTEAATHYFTMALPTGLNQSYTSYTVDVSGDVTCDGATTTSEVIDEVTYYYTKISNIAGNGGAIRVTATDNNNTPGDNTDDKVAQFVLTIPYSASTGQKWDFYRMKHVSSDSPYGLYIGNVEDYDGDDNQTVSAMAVNSHTATQHWNGSAWNSAWTTSTDWTKIYRKGKEQPRWAYTHSMRGYNAFVIEETAGLIIETGPKGFYTDNPHQPTEWAYNHIGLHNNASITIPKLKAGDYIALNMARVTSNSGALLSVSNVKDLSGTTVDHTFSISRSQDDYSNGGNPATDDSGARIIPGYYTFQAAADGDVTITLADEGYLDILSIEIYNNGYDAYRETRDSKTGYNYTMKPIVTDGTYTTPPATFLMDTGDQEEVNLALCHYMWSTGVGPADYILEDQIGNLDATLENVEWTSDGGATYNKGKIMVNDGYGKMLVRMNNYTAEGRYLIGYTPTYALTVGRKPHQDYPYTWNFENISGGAVKGKGNNAYNNISSDPYTWTGLGYETYQLDTRTSGGSLYVPGATLVTADRSLGEKGTIAELNAANQGCDEFNGLGFTGQIAFKVAQQGTTANDAPTGDWTQGTANELLLYDFKYAASSAEDNAYTAQSSTEGGKTTWTSAELTAGDGKITFGSPGKRETTAGKGITLSYTGATFAYRMDGGNTKNALLKPQRPFQQGDVITLHGYSTASVNLSGFSFYAGANDNAYDALLTLNWPSSTATEEQEIVYTIQQGDGLAGRSEVYLCRAGKQYTVLLTEVKIEGDDASAPAGYERALTCVGAVTVTVPDLVVDDYVYIKASAEPTAASLTVSNLTAAVTEDGLDAATGVYKYKKTTANGNADLVFDNDTKIYRIGVTNIMKPMKQVGTGDAWATESRDHAIDYTQTGQFTVNNIKANTVTAKSYTGNKVTVKMNEKTDAMPAETGMVLKLKMAYTTDDEKSAGVKMTTEEAATATTNAATNFAKTKNYNSTNKTGEVPLFYPPYSATILNSGAVAFGGTEGNLMKANVTSKTFTSEIETIETVDYVPFIFADRYMKWTKIDNAVQHTDNFINSGNVPVFYRMHLYTTNIDGEGTATELNTLGANKAYMLIRSGNVPDALWKNQATPARPFIAIEGVSDMEEILDSNNENNGNHINNGTYNLRGQRVNDNDNLPPGIYIRNGKKVVVK
ncbi:MAG: hypothetical protein IJJ68_06460 [Prevotella sp.]|nr:hypothetical protein [Prevotella sp.]